MIVAAAAFECKAEESGTKRIDSICHVLNSKLLLDTPSLICLAVVAVECCCQDLILCWIGQEVSGDLRLEPHVTAQNAKVTEPVLLRIDNTGTWRLVFEVEAATGDVAELKAYIACEDRILSETWLYQWIDEE